LLEKIHECHEIPQFLPKCTIEMPDIVYIIPDNFTAVLEKIQKDNVDRSPHCPYMALTISIY